MMIKRLLSLVLFAVPLSSFCQGKMPLHPNSENYRFLHIDNTDGLSNNGINSIYKDRQGFVWFGTLDGLNRYDGNKIRVFSNKEGDSTSLASNVIWSITEGPDHRLWIRHPWKISIYNSDNENFEQNADQYLKSIGIPLKGLHVIRKGKNNNFWLANRHQVFCYNSLTKKTRKFVNIKNDTTSIAGTEISTIAEDNKGDIWIIYSNAVFEKLDQQRNKVVYRYRQLNKVLGKKAIAYEAISDHDGDLWVYAPWDANGVFYLDYRKNKIIHFSKENSRYKLNANSINQIRQDSKKQIWIATDNGGINVVRKSDFSIHRIVHRANDDKSIGQNTVNSLYLDDQGIMWAGTYKRGVSYFHESAIKFPLSRYTLATPRGIVTSDVNAFAEDAEGNLWIGTSADGLLYYDKKTGKFSQYRHNPSDKNSLNDDRIVNLYIDHEQKLWVSTFWAGLDYFDGKKFIHYRYLKTNPKGISDDWVLHITESSDNELWLGTVAGLDKFDRKTNSFVHYKREAPNGVKPRMISSLSKDKNGNIWIGSYDGLEVWMKKSKKFVHYSHHDNDRHSIISNSVYNVYVDDLGRVWAATREGISVLDPSTGKFSSITRENGLHSNNFFSIQEDANHNIWLSYLNGLTHIVTDRKNKEYTFSLRNYEQHDGPAGNEFNAGSGLRTKNGDLIFGSSNGFIRFNPLKIERRSVPYKLLLTDFQLFNRSVAVSEKINGRVPLEKSITETRSLTLNYHENLSFAIEFAAVNFLNPDNMIYKYKLDGFDKDWIASDTKIRKATYTNLNPGKYLFRVRSSSADGLSNDREKTLRITVLPPFWKTFPAYVIYFFIAVAVLLLIRSRGIRKLKREFEAEQERIEARRIVEEERKEAQRMIDMERKEAKRMHELDEMKIKFLTNVSHEFRTPISLIMAPIDNLIENAPDEETGNQFKLISRNARRLLNMVNQLLDFRKMEMHELKLSLAKGDIVSFIKDISYSFTDIADRKNIIFCFNADIERFDTRFDHDKVERILFNLLSNSFKFTPEGGRVSVLLNINGFSDTKDSILEIKVIDTGIGIPKAKQDKIFDRFFQSNIPDSILNQGSGIGLSITKEFVHLHGGKIEVESEPGEGSCFCISLPLSPANPLALLPEESDASQFLSDVRPKEEKQAVKRPTILLVEDNDDLRAYLKENLNKHFEIIEASNGKLGWQKALALHPDLMVSDVSMPEMNGIDLCRKIKQDKRTAYIPVILLTALTGEEQQLNGLQIGANDYITKPFNFEILLSKIRNLLSFREALKKTYKKQVDFQVPVTEVVSGDEKFMGNVLKYIEDNMTKNTLSIQEISNHIGMNRVSLYKKILALTGKSPVELIHHIKLNKAVQLLEKNQMKVSEIAYAVGFNSPKYFGRLFKSQYKMLPSEYAAKFRSKEPAEV